MGKYTHLLKDLPKLPHGYNEGPSYQERVNEEKDKIKEKTAIELAGKWDLLREVEEKLEEKLKQINIKLDAYKQLIEDAYEKEGVTSLKLESSGSTIRTQPEPHAAVEDRDAVRNWAQGVNLDDLRRWIREGNTQELEKWATNTVPTLERSLALPWMTLNSLTKEALLAGNPEPPGVKAYVRTKLVRTKAKE